jgi:hypothetical protein
MARAETLTDVANLALASIGERLIANINSDGDVENIVNNVLCETIRQVQTEIYWDEIRTQVEPSALPEMYPPSPSLYQYQLPTNFLNVVNLSSGAEYFIENGLLVTSDPQPMVTYVRYSEEVTEWSAYMVELVYRKLAYNISMHLTQNANISQMAFQSYKEAEMKNLTRSANRRRKSTQRENIFGNLRARRYGRRFY